MLDWSQIVKLTFTTPVKTSRKNLKATKGMSTKRLVKSSSTKTSNGVDWIKAEDVHADVVKIVKFLHMDWIDLDSIHCFRSENSRARAYARIWGLSKIWQIALQISPKYCIEVLSENYDHLSANKKAEVLIHELCHIPKNFSGSLLPHTRKRGKRNFHDRVHVMVSLYSKSSKQRL